MESSQFETLMSAITGLKSEVSGIKYDLGRLETKMDTGFAEVRKEMTTGLTEVRKEMTAGFADVYKETSSIRKEMTAGFAGVRKEMRTGFTEVRQDLKIIREQVAQTHVDVTDFNRRVTHLEGPRA